MNIIISIWKKLFSVKDWFLKRSSAGKIGILSIIAISAWFIVAKLLPAKAPTPQYQTIQVQKGTLVVAVTASGQVASINNTPISTRATGIITKVYASDGTVVQAGDKIAEIDLDLVGKQNEAQALASYLSAKNSLQSAKDGLFTLQSDMLTKWKTFMEIAQSSTYQNNDLSPKTDQRQLPQFVSTDDDWLATEAKYKLQQQVIAQAQTSLNSAWMSYQQSSSIVYAPISGTVTGFSLQVGSVIAGQSSTSGSTTTITSQKVGNIKTAALPMVSINLTQIDVPKVKLGDKATLTFDGSNGKTYTGAVVSIDTVGVVSLGVTTYPTVIKLDTDAPDIFSNMSASASIITEIREDVITVPVSSVQTQNGQSSVRVMRNKQLVEVPVETGISSDTDIEVTSGLSEGDTVVTSVTTTATSTQTQTSPFSPFGRGGGFGGARNSR